MNSAPRCLQYVVRRHGQRLAWYEASRLCKLAAGHSRLEHLAAGFQGIGFDACVTERLRWEDLQFLRGHGKSVVVDWWTEFSGRRPHGHLAVLERSTDAVILLWDPDVDGFRELPRSVFEAHWYDEDWSATRGRRRSDRRDRVRAAVVVNGPGRPAE